VFETAEVGHAIDKATYEKAVPDLREALLEAQWGLHENHGFPVVVLIAGVDGAGKGETVNLLHAWMDPRHIHTVAFSAPTEEEQQRPRMWRYWRALPPKGKIGILFGSWYTEPIVNRVWGRCSSADLENEIERINAFEKMLADEGALIVKFWFHLSKKAQKKRLKAIDADPKRTWRVTKADWRQFERYDDYYSVSEHTLRLTSTGHAPWIVVEGADERYRSLTVGTVLLQAIRNRLDAPADQPAPRSHAAPLVKPIDNVTILDRMDLTRRVGPKKYRSELETWQGELNRLVRHKRFADLSVIAAFEGMDAAGKGGAIRRITGALDARQYQTIPVAAPTDEERAQPYLWRFWRHLPRRGRLTIYDRTWYGRVLVERIEGFCAEADWMRAYAEINQFEQELLEGGVVLCKFWLQISPDEQLRRFQEREKTGFKRFKITAEDWRNRDKWDAYQQAAADMIERTSTEIAPWTLVEAEDKNWARMKILRTLAGAIEDALRK
jgi:polyphosphate:AMP phosphotransferase